MGNEIVQKDDKSLRQKSKEIPIEDIKSRRIETIINRMKRAVESQDDGVALAAPQIGENLRIFVISHRLFEFMEEEKLRSKDTTDREKLDAFEKSQKEFKDMVFINPEIIKTSKEQQELEEGCLSVRWLYGKVKRAKKATIRAYDENGKLFTMGGVGLLAQAFQHEVDHLNGVLFTDKAKSLEELPPQI
ncbi:MAG: peptide deformylase [Candidatus Zambryskibacteria bacterium]|nr:peptide deformylase [Candidatus Zambryskibacteria bacterium]